MEIREERQANPVEDPVSALVAVTRPIINGVVQSIGAEYVKSFPTRGDIPLYMIGRLRKESDGDIGVAFEYAIHEAIQKRTGSVTDRVSDALKLCNIRRGDPASILFAIEKQGAKQLISTDLDLITDSSRALSGRRGQPVLLKKHLNQLAAAFRRPTTRPNLPQSINGLWKADLFLGSPEPDHWVGTTVKINLSRLESAAGLRIAIVPAQPGRSDRVYLDGSKQLVVCPVPHDQSFMETFYEGWRLIQSLCASDFNMPAPAAVPSSLLREVAKVYVERRLFSVADVLEATAAFAQPHLLETSTESVTSTAFQADVRPETSTVLGPFPIRHRDEIVDRSSVNSAERRPLNAEEMREFAQSILERIPRGSTEQNLFRSNVQMSVMNALGQRSEFVDKTVADVLDWAAEEVSDDFVPDYDPALRDLAWPSH